MKILVCHGSGPSNFPSGELSVIEREADYLRRQGHTVYHYFNNDAVGWNVFSLFWSRLKNRELANKIQELQPDVVHFHSVVPYLGLLSLSVPKRFGIPVVQTLHNGRWVCVEGGYIRDDTYCEQCVGNMGWKGVVSGCGHGYAAAFLLFFINLYARVTGKLFLWVSKFIAVSTYVKRQHILSGFPGDQILVNNNGVDLDEFEGKSSSWKKRQGIAFVGRVSVAKGSDVLKSVISSVKCPIHIVGDGPELCELQQYCESNGYTHVVFWGKLLRQQVLEVLGSVVCAVVPSQCGDSFPTVVVESMALGTPVVASDLGGLPDLVGAGGGVVVVHDKADQFIDSINDFLCNREQAELSGKNARKYVQEHLSTEVTGKRLLSIYEELFLEK